MKTKIGENRQYRQNKGAEAGFAKIVQAMPPHVTPTSNPPALPCSRPGNMVIEVLRRRFPGKNVITGVLTGQFPEKKFM